MMEFKTNVQANVSFWVFLPLCACGGGHLCLLLMSINETFARYSAEQSKRKRKKTCDRGLLDWIKEGLTDVRGEWSPLWGDRMVNFPYFISTFAKGPLAPKRSLSFMDVKSEIPAQVNTHQRPHSRVLSQDFIHFGLFY